MEPRPRTAAAGQEPPRAGAEARTPSFHLRAFADPNARAGLAAAGLTACLVGLIGADGGILWVVAGVWTVRTACGTPVGAGWGAACLVAGLRWGTLSLADLQAATRLVGSTLTTGSLATRAAMVVVLTGALLDEARIDGLNGRTWGERAASIGALLALTALFVLPGQDPGLVAAASWMLAPALAVAGVALAGPNCRSLPEWAPFFLVAVGAVLVVMAP